jgi:TonB family protein
VPFSDLLDTVEITLNDSAPLDDSVEITLDANASLDESDERSEPTLLSAPFLIEFDEPARLDPRRVGLIWELPSPAGSGMRWRSSLSALAVHLFPLLLIIGWPATANEVPVIPVQLVLEQPPPPAAQPPQSQPRPQPPPEQPKPGRLASEDLGEVKPKDPGAAATTEATPAAGEKQQEPTETQTATTAATPPPLPPPKPAPPKDSPAVHPPKPSGAVTPHHEETPHEAPRAARFAGPASSRDEYLAYLVTLTRQHIDLLPLTIVGTRRGETIVSVTVQDDGTISHTSVFKSSGYADIDERIEQMVSAVHKFPPVPQWFQGNSIELELTLRFPEALERD